MRRTTYLLIALGAVAVLAIYWLFVFQPQREALAEVERQIATEEQAQAQLQAEITRLRAVREEAPRVMSELASAESIVPAEAGLPSALRQLQTAADEAGLTLVSVAPGRPEQVAGAEIGVVAIPLNVQLQGSYFQTVDFLRRTEDPAITPRAMLWGNAAVSKQEYPTLTVALTGQLFAVLPTIPEAPAEPDATNGDADVEVDLDVNVEEGVADGDAMDGEVTDE